MAARAEVGDKSEAEELFDQLRELLSSTGNRDKMQAETAARTKQSWQAYPPPTMNELPKRFNAIGFTPAPSLEAPAQTTVPAFGKDAQIQGGGGTDTLLGGKRQPRGIRNNNPGNIEYGRFTRARGATGSDGRFAKFESPEAGIAAIYDLQRVYEQEHGLTTVMDRISRWAPASENNTTAYANAVAARMGIGVNEPFAIDDPQLGPAFVSAVIEHENGGNPYGTAVVTRAQNSRLAAGPPAADEVPLPRISPTQRAMAQTAPAGTEPVSGSAPLAYEEPAVPAASVEAERALQGIQAMAAPAATAAVAEPAPATVAPAKLRLESDREPEGLSIRIKRGDTLWDIAERYYGDGTRWGEISRANAGIQPERLMPGMVLQLPGVEGPPTPGIRENAVKGADNAGGASAPRTAPVQAPATSLPAAPENPPAPAAAPAIAIPPGGIPAPRPGRRQVESDDFLVPEGFDIDELTRIAPAPGQSAAYEQRRPEPAVQAPPTVADLERVVRERTGDPNTSRTAAVGEPGGPVLPASPVSTPARAAIGVPAEARSGSLSLAQDLQKSRQYMEGSAGVEQLARPAGAPEVQVAGEGSPWKSVLDNPITNGVYETVFGPDSAFHGLTLAPESAPATIEAPRLNLEPVAPAVPAKDQSRIDPNAPSQKQPAFDSGVKAPRDAVTGTDFVPISPAAFSRGKNPSGVSDVKTFGTQDGVPHTVSYRQGGYAVQSMSDGLATRTPIGSGGSPGGPTEMWNPSNNTWTPVARPPATVQPAGAPAKKVQVNAAGSGNSGWFSKPGLSTQF